MFSSTEGSGDVIRVRFDRLGMGAPMVILPSRSNSHLAFTIVMPITSPPLSGRTA